MKADVEPFPFVPVMCMTLSLLRSLSWEPQVTVVCQPDAKLETHVIADSVQVLEHLWYGQITAFPSRCAYSLKCGSVSLKGVKGVDGFTVGPYGHDSEEG